MPLDQAKDMRVSVTTQSASGIIQSEQQLQVCEQWDDTSVDYPQHHCLHTLFEIQVAHTPELQAVVFEGQSISYHELNCRANQLARYLIARGVAAGSLVPISMDRSIDMVVALLGILKAGAAYVPMDSHYPQARLELILTETNAPVFLADSNRHTVSRTGVEAVYLNDAKALLAGLESHNLEIPVSPEHCAYVIYTSGSTGTPKGVMIHHKAIVNHMFWMREAFVGGPVDRVLARTTYTFDASVWEFFLPLTTGATMILARSDQHFNPIYLIDLIVAERVTIAQFVPSILRLMLETKRAKECVSLRLVCCGGEPLTTYLVAELFKQVSCGLCNLYGPTECTIDSTYWMCRPDEDFSIVPIGRPVANTHAYILDEGVRPVPVGEAGELYIGGVAVGMGYLNRPQQNAERFLRDPFRSEDTGRMYKTGDMVRYLPSGNIEYLGRYDFQVKINGLRIELGEIESALNSYPGIETSVVVAHQGRAQEQRLIAYCATKLSLKRELDKLRRFLLTKLPSYMVPAVFVALPGLPLTLSGKVDRKALPPLKEADAVVAEEYVGPRNATEKQLVKIWRRVLGASPIGVTNSFFELGGTSLAAVRVMRHIGEIFGKQLAIGALIEAPTIERLAFLLENRGGAVQQSCLISIQPHGSKPPLFCIHGAGGAVNRFYDLARCLGTDQPVYGLQARGLDGNQACHRTLEDMAAHYITEVQTVSSGPYMLAGYSLGGLIAMEMGQQLLERGCAPPPVILFDTRCGYSQTNLTFRRYLRSLLGAHGTIHQLEWSGVASRMKHLRDRALGRLRDMTLPRNVRNVMGSCLRAGRQYTPRPYPGKMILFQSITQFSAQNPDLLGWDRCAVGGLDVHPIEGDHENLLFEPQVRFVAGLLKEHLDSLPQGGQATPSTN